MIVSGVKVIKLEDTNTYDWLPIIYQTLEIGLSCFTLDSEREDFFPSSSENKKKREKRIET